MKSKISIPLVSIIFFAACSGEKKEEGTRLAFNPENGKTVKMVYEVSATTVNDGYTTKYTVESSGSTEKNKQGDFAFTFSNDKVTLNANFGGREFKFDASNPAEIPDSLKPVTTPYFGLMNMKFRSVFDARMNKVSENVVHENAGETDSTENKIQYFIRYPDTNITAGSSWKKDLYIKTSNKMISCAAVYTVKEIKDGKAVIAIRGKLSGGGDPYGHNFNIDGNLEGTITVDLATGWPLLTEITEDYTMEMNEAKVPVKFSLRHSISL